MSERAAGLDVSLWQDDDSTPQMVDFSVALRASAAFSFIKASQGTWVDEDFLLNWKHAKAAGMPRGAYHYLDWDVSPAEQARFFAGLLRSDPGELPPVLDYERRTGVPGRAKAVASAWVFVQEVEELLGQKPILYTSPSYWNEFGSKDPIWAGYRLWIANYYVAAPTLPAPWSTWEFWQWGSGKGLGPRYGAESKDIDQDWFNGAVEELRARYHLTDQQPPVEPVLCGLPMRVTTSSKPLMVRSGPGQSYPIVGQLPKGTEVEALNVGGQNAWVFIDGNGLIGWACAQLGTDRFLVATPEERHA